MKGASSQPTQAMRCLMNTARVDGHASSTAWTVISPWRRIVLMVRRGDAAARTEETPSATPCASVLREPAVDAFLEDPRVLRAFNDQVTRTPLLDTAERMIDQDVGPRHFELDLRHDGAAGCYRHRLHIVDHFGGRRTHRIDAIEDLADHVERRGQIRSADAKVEPDRLADF